MTRMLRVTALALLVGCGAESADGPTADAPADFGELEQALYVPTGYGADGNQNRCGSPFAGGVCLMPDTREWLIIVPDSGEHQGCSRANVRTQIDLAAREWSFKVNQQGWSTAVVGASVTEVGGVAITCSGDASSTNKRFGVTTVSGPCGTPGTDCHSTPRGTIQQYADASILMYPERVYANTNISFPNGFGNFGGLHITQQNNFIFSLVMHELGHLAGLGHTGYATSKLMGLHSFNDLSPFNGRLYPTTEELNMIKCYRETSGTTPRC
jgi:hypothetical protein